MPATPVSVLIQPEITPRRKKGRSQSAIGTPLPSAPKTARSPQRQREQLSDWSHAS